MISLIPTTKADPDVRKYMKAHYSSPKGFVGRQLIYRVEYDGVLFGAIAAGSATRFLPGRENFFKGTVPLNNLINNTFFHLERDNGKYPSRNFSTNVVKTWREISAMDWLARYGDVVVGYETLVELPRTGELYLRDGWKVVGTTKGYTCKRTGGRGTDGWSGRRVWDTVNLRPKLVLVRGVDVIN